MGEQLAEGIGHMDHTDIGRTGVCRGEGLADHLGGQRAQIAAFTLHIAGEVALVTPEDPHVGGHVDRRYYN